MKPLLTLIFAVIPFLTYSQDQINILDTKGSNLAHKTINYENRI